MLTITNVTLNLGCDGHSKDFERPDVNTVVAFCCCVRSTQLHLVETLRSAAIGGLMRPGA